MLARLRPYVFLFLGLTVVYHVNLRPIDSSDSFPGALIPLALVLDHTICLDRFVPWLRAHVWYTPSVIHQASGHSFSSYPIGGPLLVSPLYFPLAFSNLSHWDPASLVMFARIAGKFSAAAVTALSAVLLLLLLKRITSTAWAWWLTLVYALATETWSISSQALWQHGPGELAIVGCFYCLERGTEDRARSVWPWLCGACVAAAFLIRPTNLVLWPGVLAGLLLVRFPLTQRLRDVARVSALPFAAGVVLAGYNLYVFQHLSGGYTVTDIHRSILPALAGLFVSPGRGLLIYTPVALFALAAFLPAASAARRRHNPLLVTAVGFIILELLVILESLVISQSTIWWGGFCWGPRLLTELVPPLVVLMAIGVQAIDRPWPRRAFAVLAVYSLLIQAVGVFFYPNGHWDATPEAVDAVNGRLWDWWDNPIARTVHGGLYWQPYAIVGAAITGGLPAARLRMRELNVNPYEQAEPGKLSRTSPGLP
jgi:hypothetical protein